MSTAADAFSFSMNPTQLNFIDRFRSGILESIKAYPVRYGAICIITPFIGFAGEQIKFYVTEDGEITDGGATINLFKSLRCYQDFCNWPSRDEYLESNGINIIDGCLVCKNPTPHGIFQYVQVMAELQTQFEAHPLGAEEAGI